MKTFGESFVILAILLTIVVQGQTEKRVLNLDEAIRLAVENNRELKNARMDMEKADYRVSEAIGTALPNITATGMYTRAIKKPVFFLPDFQNPESGRIIPIEIGSDNSLQFGFQATQILFNSAVFTGVGAAKIYQDASREIYRNAYNQTIANVKRAYYGVIFTRQVFEMTRASLQNAEDNLRQVEVRAREGIVAEYDLIRARVQTENIRPAVIDAERNVLVATNGLKILLGIDPKEEIDVRADLEYQPADPALLVTAEEQVVEQNAAIRAMEHQKRVNEEMVSIYRSESLPTLAAFGNYQWQAQKNTFDFSTNDLVRSSQVGLNLNVNLFNGFQTSSRIGQAEIDFRKSEELLTSMKYAMRTNVQSILLRLESAQKRIEAQGLNIEQAEKGYRIAVTRYRTGSGTQLEVNDADVALLRARVNRIQAVYDYQTAKTDLEEALSLQHP